MAIDHVAIVGGGFSGTLQAINLLRHGGPRATLIERRPMAGEGLAFGAASPGHLLNVRAANMSAFPDDPGHFVRWLEARGAKDAASAFVPRLTYGAYLRELLGEAAAGSGGRLVIRHGEAVDLAPGRCVTVRLGDGAAVEADTAVLAVGNLPPHDPAGLDSDLLSADRYKSDPWDPSVPEGLSATDTILIVGTGLTMIDVALLLARAGFGGRIVALSRRGLTPRVHAAGGDWRRINERPGGPLSDLLRRVRTRGATIGWRQAVDELRPFTQDMWRAAGGGERRRFIRHLRPWWDVHRHRIAPEVATEIEAMRRDGRLEIVAGKPIAFHQTARGIEMRWRPRGSDDVRRLEAARVVNCTGPLGDLARTDDPLLRRLLERGAIRPDSAHLGIDVDAQARTIGADGGANDWLYALGPMTRGAFWEIVAVPDIRAQTWSLARLLSNAHWVGGEGL